MKKDITQRRREWLGSEELSQGTLRVPWALGFNAFGVLLCVSASLREVLLRLWLRGSHCSAYSFAPWRLCVRCSFGCGDAIRRARRIPSRLRVLGVLCELCGFICLELLAESLLRAAPRIVR